MKKIYILFHEGSQYTGVWKYCGVFKLLRCLSKFFYTKMLRIHLFSIFTSKTPRALAALAPLGILIVKTLTNVLLTITLKPTVSDICYIWYRYL